jgi:threonylcarbamoyladenosine tRNA methylthiotransferase MtaB
MKIYLDTIGCRLNQAEVERMAQEFRFLGHEIVAQAQEAELAVINTCAVTVEAASDSRNRIRAAARAGVPQIIATGCWATLEPAQAAAMPQVQRVIPNAQKDALVAEVLGLPPELFEREPLEREPLPGLRMRTRAFLKVQDGCNNHCTFCITTVARGAARSYPLQEVVRRVQAAVASGTQEVVLTGVHLGSWGQEWGLHLRHLIQAILQDTDLPRLRLSSLEPWDLDEAFFRLWENPRLCRHLHLPLQSGSRSVLRRMARKTTPESFRALVQAARSVVPHIAITTDIIAGFPGETEAEFRESLEFVEAMEFAGGHVFTYSPRPGTAATRLPGQVPPEIRKQRNAAYRALFTRQAQTYRQRFVGSTEEVLWESILERDEQGWRLEGLGSHYLRVVAHADQPLWNQISQVRLNQVEGERLVGQIVA